MRTTEYRFLNSTAANRERTAFRNEGYRVTPVARDIVTGGYFFQVVTGK